MLLLLLFSYPVRVDVGFLLFKADIMWRAYGLLASFETWLTEQEVFFRHLGQPQCAQVFYRTSNTYLFFPIGLSEFFNPMDICWKYNQGWSFCSSCGYFYLRTRNTMYFQKISLNVWLFFFCFFFQPRKMRSRQKARGVEQWSWQNFFEALPKWKKKCVVCVHLASYREPVGRWWFCLNII